MFNWITLSYPMNPTAGASAQQFAQTWGAMRPLGGEELNKAQQIAQKSTYLMTIPFQSGVLESMVASITEPDSKVRTFQIEFIDDTDNRHIELKLYVFEMDSNSGE